MPYVNLEIPDAIGEAEWSLYKRMLTISPEQDALFGSFFSEYVSRDRQIRATRIASLWERSGEIGLRRDFTENQDSAEQYLELFRDRSSVVSELEQNDLMLFDAVEPFLAEEQLPSLERARRYRSRTRSNVVGNLYSIGWIDLLTLLANCPSATGEVLTELDAWSRSRVVVAYDEEITRLFRHRYTARIRGIERDPLILAELQRVGAADLAAGGEPSVEYLTILEERGRLLRSSAGIVERIHKLNLSTLDQLPYVTDLSPEAIGALRECFNATAYPIIYPSEFRIDDAIERLLTFEEFAGEARETAVALNAMGRSKITAVEHKLVVRYTSWMLETLSTYGYSHDGLAEYRSDMQDLQRERQEATLDLLRSLEPVVEGVDDAAELIRKRRAYIEAWIPEDDEWPQPYE